MQGMDQNIERLSHVQKDLLATAQAYQDMPPVINIIRQTMDSLNITYLLLTSIGGAINQLQEQIEAKVAKGDVVQFPGPAPKES